MLKMISNIVPRLTARSGIAQCFLVLMFLANVIPLFKGQAYAVDGYLVDEAARSWQLVGLGALMAATFVSSDLRIAQNKVFMLVIVPFTIYLLVNAVFSDVPEISAQYTLLFFGVATAVAILRLQAEDWLKAFRLASLALSAALVVFVLTKTRDGRFWGAAHPNVMGTWILVLAILATAWRNWLRWSILGLTLFVGVTVDSRFSVLGMLLLFVSFTFINSMNSLRKAVVVSLIILIAGAGTWSISSSFFEGQGDRSLESGGISGRDVLWDEAFQRISKHPIFGSGFRTSTTAEAETSGPIAYGSHSGLIAVVDELGVVGLAGFLAMFVWRANQLLRSIRNSKDPAVQHLNSIFLAGIVADMAPLMFQPNYINFGDPLGLFVMLALFVQIKRSSQLARASLSNIGANQQYQFND
jgi:O-antigen ligase